MDLSHLAIEHFRNVQYHILFAYLLKRFSSLYLF